MKKIKNLLFSEKGMRMVNVLFFLSAFFYRSGLLFIAYAHHFSALSLSHRDSSARLLWLTEFFSSGVSCAKDFFSGS